MQNLCAGIVQYLVSKRAPGVVLQRGSTISNLVSTATIIEHENLPKWSDDLSVSNDLTSGN